MRLCSRPDDARIWYRRVRLSGFSFHFPWNGTIKKEVKIGSKGRNFSIWKQYFSSFLCLSFSRCVCTLVIIEIWVGKQRPTEGTYKRRDTLFWSWRSDGEFNAEPWRPYSPIFQRRSKLQTVFFGGTAAIPFNSFFEAFCSLLSTNWVIRKDARGYSIKKNGFFGINSKLGISQYSNRIRKNQLPAGIGITGCAVNYFGRGPFSREKSFPGHGGTVDTISKQNRCQNKSVF